MCKPKIFEKEMLKNDEKAKKLDFRTILGIAIFVLWLIKKLLTH